MERELQKCINLSNLAIERVSSLVRHRVQFGPLLRREGRSFVGLLGLRGVGKTVLLRQLAANHDDAIYISMDTLSPQEDIFELIRLLHERYRYTRFFLDEIHFHRTIDRHLKQISDFLPVEITFTSSVALAIHQSSYDLSRRVLLREVMPFRFDEYLAFVHHQELPSIDIDSYLNGTYDARTIDPLATAFSQYLTGGLMPFALEEPDPLSLLRRVLETVIEQDIPRVAPLKIDELPYIHSLVRLIGSADGDGLSYSAIANTLGVTKYKAEQYCALLHRAFILNVVLPAGKSVRREPKILMTPPFRLLFCDPDRALGALREDFTAMCLRGLSLEFAYLKSTRGRKTPDFLIRHRDQKVVLEVGGRSKGRSQFKGISADRKLVLADGGTTTSQQRPLHGLGCVAGPEGS